MSSTPQALIFDLGRVLVHIDQERFIDSLALILGVSPAAATEAFTAAALPYEVGETGTDEFLDKLLETPGGRFAASSDQGQQADARSKARERARRLIQSACGTRFSPMPQMIELVHELADLSAGSGGPLLALASNTNALDIRAVDSAIPLALEPFGGRRYFSHEMGMRKPHPEYFTAVAADLGVAPSACLFVDDLEQNVDGAREAGMEAIVFRDAAALATELRSRLGSAAGALSSIVATGLAGQR